MQERFYENGSCVQKKLCHLRGSPQTPVGSNFGPKQTPKTPRRDDLLDLPHLVRCLYRIQKLSPGTCCSLCCSISRDCCTRLRVRCDSACYTKQTARHMALGVHEI